MVRLQMGLGANQPVEKQLMIQHEQFMDAYLQMPLGSDCRVERSEYRSRIFKIDPLFAPR
ncbi:hypothetical protein ED208_11330 [Stagnimonas aquatica]|uniref:Uncharacterized protein n=1 Tax=Stagnimonas aquatica TaxID=2689987 RepID=A0A3N0VA93_9GAMM|nr:hypothetical protein ED208_11330 [Stagnimonas aquatica]